MLTRPLWKAVAQNVLHRVVMRGGAVAKQQQGQKKQRRASLKACCLLPKGDSLFMNKQLSFFLPRDLMSMPSARAREPQTRPRRVLISLYFVSLEWSSSSTFFSRPYETPRILLIG